MSILAKNLPYARDVCKFGQLEKCCRYLGVDEKGWICFKITEEYRKEVDRRVAMGWFTAVADNCEGKDLR